MLPLPPLWPGRRWQRRRAGRRHRRSRKARLGGAAIHPTQISAVNVATGANIVTEGAFSNASGLPMVIQNSGANVLIQNATIINVQIK